MTSAPPSAATTSRWLLLFLISVGACVLFICTRHNTFPFTYHPDEDTKVRQIVSGKRNFFHPLLLLTTTDAVFQSRLFPKTPMQAAILGRWVAATYTALSVVALVWLAFRWGGWLSASAAAVFLILNPLTFELAHYFKEDPCLLIGIAAAFLALDFLWNNPSPSAAACLGIASALAISGKYLGAVILLFTIPPLIVRSRKNPRLALWFVGGFLVVLVLVNFSLLRHFSDFQRGLGREVDGATEGHRGLNRQIPHGYYLQKLPEITPWAIWLGLGCTSFLVFGGWKRTTLPQKLALLFPIFFVILLSFSPKTASRYLLPAEVFLAFLGGLAPGMFLQRSPSATGRNLAIVSGIGLFGLAAMSSWPMFSEAYGEYSTDSRTGLRHWLEQKTSADAIIAQDGRVDLLADPNWTKRTVETSEFAADLGTVEDLRRTGVSYVAVTRQSYNRFVEGTVQPNARQKADFARRTTFYKTLFSTGNPVWESQVGSNIYLNPGIRLYRIRPDQ